MYTILLEKGRAGTSVNLDDVSFLLENEKSVKHLYSGPFCKATGMRVTAFWPDSIECSSKVEEDGDLSVQE